MAPKQGKVTAAHPESETVTVSKGGGSMSISLESYKPPVVTNPQIAHKAGIAPFGTNNQYPQHSLEQFRNSPTHGAICRFTAKLFAGIGFDFTGAVVNEDWVKGIGYNRSIDRIGEQWALDRKIHSGFAVEVMWAIDGKSIAKLKYVDFSHVRKNLDENEKLIDYRLCKRWTVSTTLATKGVVPIPVFDPSKVTRKQTDALGNILVDANGKPLDAIDPETVLTDGTGGLPFIDQPSQLYYYECASPGMLNYPEPDYMHADVDIKIDRLFKGFHVNNLLNGLLPSLFITINGPEPEPEIKAKLKRDMGRTFKGEDGSKAFVVWNDGDQGIDVTPLDVKNNESRYLEIAKYVKGEIVSAHMMPSPLLAGIAANGTIGGSGTELQVAFQMYSFTVGVGGQKDLMEGLQHIFDSAGMDVQVAIKPLDPFANLATNAAPATPSTTTTPSTPAA